MSTPWRRSLRLLKTEKTFIFGGHMTRGLQRSQCCALEGKSLHIVGYPEHAVADWANAVAFNNKCSGWVMAICSNYNPMYWDRTN
ncbi:hypothetical protein IWW34DRAFT_887205 [Fusarium oxysporum f. sp. albedinis]|nr:hypothetical protein IWW34DRAFT_887205 [Fusarium oxysporum f. sp. albedinis]